MGIQVGDTQSATSDAELQANCDSPQRTTVEKSVSWVKQPELASSMAGHHLGKDGLVQVFPVCRRCRCHCPHPCLRRVDHPDRDSRRSPAAAPTTRSRAELAPLWLDYLRLRKWTSILISSRTLMGHPEVVNQTPFAFAALHLVDEEFRPLLVPLVKGTFDLHADGRCLPAERQVPPSLEGDVGATIRRRHRIIRARSGFCEARDGRGHDRPRVRAA